MKRVLDVLDRFNDRVYRLQKVLLILLSSLMTIVALAQIAGRFIFHYSLTWSEELSTILFIVITLWGCNIAIKTDNEIAVEIIKFHRPRPAMVHAIIKDILSLICIALLLCSLIAAIQESTVRVRVVASMRWFKYTYIYALMLVGMIFVAFDKIVRLLHHIYSLGHPGEEEAA